MRSTFLLLWPWQPRAVITNAMTLRPDAPALVLLLGILAGLLLWASGVDMQIQHWLWDNYHQGFNDGMRLLGELGKGTAQMLACLLVGIWWALASRIHADTPHHRAAWREPEWRFAGRLIIGLFEQLVLWAFLQFRWGHNWRDVTRGPRLLLAAVPLFVLAGLFNVALKMTVGRPRPKEILMNGGNPFDMRPFESSAVWWSFPSGHACSTFAIAVWLALAFPRWRPAFLAVAVVLSVSRFLAVTPHYLGDVIAGAAVGSAAALLLARLMKIEEPARV